VTRTLLVPNPTEEKISVPEVAFTVIRKLPSAPEVTPLLEPFGTMETFARGEPSFASVTLPVIVLFCA